MRPRHASAVVTLANYVKQVFSCDVDEWKRLPVQWRGYVLFNCCRPPFDVKSTLAMLERGRASTDYDPQGVFDAFQGLAPA
jgi:hypothetical protein